MPIKYILTGGQEAECKQAIPLLENVKALAVLADKAYGHQRVEGLVGISGNKAVIRPRSNRKEKNECDFWHYKERHGVECVFGKLKYYCGIATRYERKIY